MKQEIIGQTDEFSSSSQEKRIKKSAEARSLFGSDQELTDQFGSSKGLSNRIFGSEFQSESKCTSAGCQEEYIVGCSCNSSLLLCEFHYKSHVLLDDSQSHRKLPLRIIHSKKNNKHKTNIKAKLYQNNPKRKSSNDSLCSSLEEIEKNENTQQNALRGIASRRSIPLVSYYSANSSNSEESKHGIELSVSEGTLVQQVSKISIDFDISSQSSINSKNARKKKTSKINPDKYQMSSHHYKDQKYFKNKKLAIEDKNLIRTGNKIDSNYPSYSPSKSSTVRDSDYLPELPDEFYKTFAEDLKDNQEKFVVNHVKRENLTSEFEKEEEKVETLRGFKYNIPKDTPNKLKRSQSSGMRNKNEELKPQRLVPKLKIPLYPGRLDSNRSKKSSKRKFSESSDRPYDDEAILSSIDKLKSARGQSSSDRYASSIQSFQSSSSYKNAIDNDISLEFLQEIESHKDFKVHYNFKHKNSYDEVDDISDSIVPDIIDMKKYDKINEEFRNFNKTYGFAPIYTNTSENIKMTKTAGNENSFQLKDFLNKDVKIKQNRPTVPKLNILKMKKVLENQPESQIQSFEHSDISDTSKQNNGLSRRSGKHSETRLLENISVGKIEPNPRLFSSKGVEEAKEKGYEERDTPSFNKIREFLDLENHLNESIQLPSFEKHFSFNPNIYEEPHSPDKVDLNYSSVTNFKGEKKNEKDSQLPLRYFVEGYANFELSEPRNVWKIPLTHKLCWCFARKEELEESIEANLEHFLRFSHLKFSLEDKFHWELLDSCLVKLELNSLRFSNVDEPVHHFTHCNEYAPSLRSSLEYPRALVTLFLLRIFIDYIPERLKIMLNICKRTSRNCPLLLVMIEICESMLKFISLKKNNEFIVDEKEVLEKIFFLYVGLLLKWFEIYENTRSSWGNCKKVTRSVMDYAKLHVADIINRAVMVKAIHSK